MIDAVKQHIRKGVGSGGIGLALLPIFYGTAVGMGADPAIAGLLMLIPVGLLVLQARRGAWRDPALADALTGLPSREAALLRISALRREAAARGLDIACLAVEIDDMPAIERRVGNGALRDLIAEVARRLSRNIRSRDEIFAVDRGRVAVLLSPVAELDADVLVGIAGRLKRKLGEPVVVRGHRLYVTTSIGFATPRDVKSSAGTGLLEAAEDALLDARIHGPAAIRGFTPDLAHKAVVRDTLTDSVLSAIDAGEITPFFQPQIETLSGELAGFECLARWNHPEQGPIPPADFFPAVENAGAMGRLTERMLHDACLALRGWDREALRIPTVALNLCKANLRDAELVERTRWELDRFSLSPDRVVYEVLEDVIADGNQIVTQNIGRLIELGVGIDLDDFGTGSASIANIRRFRVNRIKIDRSFVRGLDHDDEQRRMVAAIMTMAEQLGVATLAEGVETDAERDALSRLGCERLQGFLIARPMPALEVPDWVRSYRAEVTQAPRAADRQSA